ncbi:hypothetical protein JYJ95_01395 [Corallococcus exiguus]|uniref:hypothetical protein n=1 Tax=Corallococcus exiguus TaxID=83462 RepID=UPI001A8EC467|nr:hypothetical protein [Corallococcus exiguus]MBN8465150.1 hypothetical protein [Corallococcus exiguus]
MRLTLHLAALLLTGCASPNLAVPEPPPPPPGTTRTCTLIGCGSGMTLDLPVDATLAQLRAGAFTMCRNGSCFRSRLEGFRPDREQGFLQLKMPKEAGRFPLMELSTKPLPTGGTEVRVSYGTDPEMLKQGDIYRVTFQAVDGRTLGEFRGTAQYQKVEPNGPDCGTCYHVYFKRTP